MAKENQPNQPVTLPNQAPPGVVGQGLPVIASHMAQPAPPPGVFDEIKRLDTAQSRSAGGEVHTFGAWCRAKGVKVDTVRQRIQSGELKIANAAGDGPEMTEAEFDRAVDFKYKNAFGEVPGVAVHIPAEQARGNSPTLPNDSAADTFEAKQAKSESNKRDV